MPERDPRVDPVKGDVLRKEKRKRTVIGRPKLHGLPWVTFKRPTAPRDVISAERLEVFIHWAKNAEVLQRGDQGEPG